MRLKNLFLTYSIRIMIDLLKYLSCIKGQTCQEIEFDEGSEAGSPHAIMVTFSSGCYLWTYHEWLITHEAITIADSFMTPNEDLKVSVKEVLDKTVIDVKTEGETMTLFISLEDHFEIIFRPSQSYARGYCLWGINDLSSYKAIWVNSASEIVVRDTYRGDEESIEIVNRHLQELIGQRVDYSRCGGGATSVLLLETNNNKNCIWGWGYWEIYKDGILMSTSEDDDTPITGKMVVAAHQLEGSIIKDVTLDEDTLDLSILFDNNCRWDILTIYNEQTSLDNWEFGISDENLFFKITSHLNIEISNYRD